MRRAPTFLAGLLLGACTANAPHASPPVSEGPEHHVEGAAAIARKTVALVALSDGEAIPFCSGVWLSSSTIVTAYHCVTKQAQEGKPVGYAGFEDVFPPRTVIIPRWSFAVVVDPLHDLALLQALDAPPGHDVAQVRLGEVLQGGFAQTMGHSMRLWWSYSSGDVAAVRELDTGDDLDPHTMWVQSTTPISAGNSGGGLFDSKAQLIGIAHAYVNQGNSLGLFVSKAHVEALMRARGSKP